MWLFILLSVLWCAIGLYSLFYFLSKEGDIKVNHLPFMFIVSFGGIFVTISFLIILMLENDNVIFKKRK